MDKVVISLLPLTPKSGVQIKCFKINISFINIIWGYLAVSFNPSLLFRSGLRYVRVDETSFGTAGYYKLDVLYI